MSAENLTTCVVRFFLFRLTGKSYLHIGKYTRFRPQRKILPEKGLTLHLL